jgi:alkylation response protein AidB-like acyl-CoA dehydrogenase
MELVLSEEQALLRDSAAAFARQAGAGRGGCLDRMREAGRAGFLALLVTPELGGSGLSPFELCLVTQALGRERVMLPMAHAAAGIFALSLSQDDALQSIYRAACEGTGAVLPAFQARSHGGPGDEVPLTANATEDGGMTISGRRFAVPVMDGVAGFIVDVRRGGDDLIVFVERDGAGLVVDRKEALDGSGLAHLSFDGLAVSSAHILAQGEAARSLKDRLEFILKAGIAAELLGLANTALDIALDYIRTRIQFGRPIASFQALQHRAVNDSAQVEAASHLLYEVARATDEDFANLPAQGSAVKAKADAVALAVLNSAIQMHGAIGFSGEYKLSPLMRRVVVLRSIVGPPGRHAMDYFDRQERSGVGLPRFRHETADDGAFREEVRDWLETTLPQHLRFLPTRPPFDDARWWHRQLFQKGWIAPGWPRAYGGMEASLAQQLILAEEFGRIGAPEISNQAIEHLGPILIAFGNREQKERHLPSMLSGATIWCQGYSEPSAGSDLASLRTRAVRDGDALIINGQKIWTTWGHYADWMFALVRTDPDAGKPQAGLTFVLIDLSSPGVTRRGIRTLTDEDELAEVFFDNVRVPVSNVVAKENDGWRVATALLTRERMRAASPLRCVGALQQLKQVAKHGLLRDPAFRERVAKAEIDVLAMTAAYEGAVARRNAGRELGAEISYIKLLTAEVAQHLHELLLEAAGSEGAVAEPLHGVHPALAFLQSRRLTIFGGTSEVQRNILAKRVLNLPS